MGRLPSTGSNLGTSKHLKDQSQRSVALTEKIPRSQEPGTAGRNTTSGEGPPGSAILTETTTGDDVQDGTGEVLSQELVQGKYIGCQRGCQPNTSGSQTKNEPTDGDTNDGEPPDKKGDEPQAEPAEPDASGHEAKVGYRTPDQPSDLASQSEASDKTGDAAKEDEADIILDHEMHLKAEDKTELQEILKQTRPILQRTIKTSKSKTTQKLLERRRKEQDYT
ncbi:hypothetical protein VTP01DRAFT_7236 [Rhizomucor pusillus]|uniref:uncharacterized protein n=1 Tax=Rhizomucor pusillus TaxID=4840 RepID=UPI0037435C22